MWRDELFYHRRGWNLMKNFLLKRPINVNLQVTWKCNFRCQVCDFWKPEFLEQHGKNELSLEQIEFIGKTLHRHYGCNIISLSGGEPLMRRDLDQVISILNRTGHFPILITNGYWVDETRAREIQHAGLQEISVSLDYADPAKHDAQRGVPGAFDRAVKALELLNKYRPKPRNRVHMISILMDDNLDQIEPLIKLARELGVTYMVNLYSCCRGTKEQHLPGHSVTEFLLDLKRRYPEFITMTSYIERFDRAISEGGIGECQGGRLFFNIDSNGDISRCIDTVGESAGNIFHDDLSGVLRKLCEETAKDHCADCWTSCRGFAECMYKKPRLRQYREFLNSVKPYAQKTD